MNQTALQPQRTLPPEIAEFCRRAVEALRAELPVREVWLFGSQVEGRANEHSDVDLFVVLEDDHGLKRPALECYNVVSALRDRPPIDVVQLPESYWNHPRYRGFGMWADIAERGICLFESGQFFQTPATSLPPMPGDPTVPETWFGHARRDLQRAMLLLEHEDIEGALPHLQQSAKKLLKGWLIGRGWHLIKTHEIDDLCTEVDRRGVRLDWFTDRKVLTKAFFQSRYPGPDNFLTRSEVEEMAGRIERLFSELSVDL